MGHSLLYELVNETGVFVMRGLQCLLVSALAASVLWAIEEYRQLRR